DDTHAAATTARDGLDDHRIPEILRDLLSLFLAVDRTVAAGQHRHARLFHGAACARFVAKQTNHVWSRADELDVAGLADFGEVGAFREEPIARMNRVGAREDRRA